MTFLDRTLLAAAALGLTAALPAQSSPNDALRDLLAGNRRFVSGSREETGAAAGRRRSLAEGQAPAAVVVTCADSAAAPERIFDAGLGDLVVVRTAGHVVGPESVAAIEHAVEQLRAPLVMVLAHEGCGVLRSSARRGDRTLTPAVARLLARIEPARRAARAQGLRGVAADARTEEEHAQATAHACLHRSTALRTATRQGRARVVAARLLHSGEVEVLPHRPLPTREVPEQPVLRGAAERALPPHVALRLLDAGHKRFLSGRPARSARVGRAADAARPPLAVVVTGADSRLAPELLFDTQQGELFVVRGAGDTARDEVLASVEFAAAELGAPLVVFLGSGDGAGRSEGATRPAAQPSVRRAAGAAREHSALLRAIEREGRLTLLGGVYDLATGDLTWVDAEDAPEPVPAMTPAAPHLEVAPPSGETAAPPPPPESREHPAEAAPASRGVYLGALAALAALLAAAWFAARRPRDGSSYST